MHVLVIGGAGYIGSHVSYELSDSGYQTTILDNLSTGKLENIDQRADFIQGSIEDLDLLSSILNNVDCVIHLAASKAAGESMTNPIKYSQSNIINTLNLIDLCIKNDVRKFIFSSSAAVYGYPEYLPIDEKHALNPINYYGFTKATIEKQLVWYHNLKGLNVACLRYFNAAGYDIKKRIKGKEKNPANLLPIIMEVASGERDYLNVFGDDYNTPDGTCLRDYIHVNDLATAHVKCIESFKKNKFFFLNLASGKYYSVIEVISKAEETTKNKIKYKIVDRRSGDPGKLYAISNDAFKVIGWKPKNSNIETILSSMWNIYKSESK